MSKWIVGELETMRDGSANRVPKEAEAAQKTCFKSMSFQ
jgi:hypothetical protein